VHNSAVHGRIWPWHCPVDRGQFQRLSLMNAPLRCGSLLRLRCPCRSVLRRRVERLPQCALEALLHAGFVLKFDRLGRRRCGSLHDPTAYGYFDVGINRILSPFDRLGLRGGLPDGHRNHARPCGYCPAKRHPERTLRSAPRNKPRFPPGAAMQADWSAVNQASHSRDGGEGLRPVILNPAVEGLR